MVPGIIVVAVMAGWVMWILLGDEGGDLVVTGHLIVPQLAIEGILWIAVVLMLLLFAYGLLRILTGNDRRQYIDLEERRIVAEGMGPFRRRIVIDYGDIRQIEHFRLGPGWFIKIKATGGKLELAELLFANREAFNMCHVLIQLAVGGVDKRGVPLALGRG